MSNGLISTGNMLFLITGIIIGSSLKKRNRIRRKNRNKRLLKKKQTDKKYDFEILGSNDKI